MANSRVPIVSVIIPIHNGEKWVDSCIESILRQDILEEEKLEISIYNDCSTDSTLPLLEEWKKKLTAHNKIEIIISSGDSTNPRGVGYAKNKAVEQSNGTYLCFQDIDDIMLPTRIRKQLTLARKYPNAIIGSQVKRLPENSTQRFISWANNLPQNLLMTQIYTSHGPTVLMPTWFLHHAVFKRVGGFIEQGKGIPEDLLFFYSHLDADGLILRVDEILVIYRYHPQCVTFSIPEYTIWEIRLSRLEKLIISHWASFTIWNAGKQGRKFYRSLKPENRKKVAQFCDVDVKKTGKYYEPYYKLVGNAKVKVPIVHITKAKAPFVICMKLDLTNGEFEKNLNDLNLIEGKDYILFS